MRQAYIQRADQVDIIKEDIRLSPYPVIVCGDFNDTPVSYTYKTLSKELRMSLLNRDQELEPHFAEISLM